MDREPDIRLELSLPEGGRGVVVSGDAGDDRNAEVESAHVSSHTNGEENSRRGRANNHAVVGGARYQERLHQRPGSFLNSVKDLTEQRRQLR